MSSAHRFAGIGLVLGLAAGLLVGAGAALAGSGTITGRPAETSPSASIAADPAAGSGTAVSGSGVAQPAIAWPYPAYPGAPGVAPAHTIVVTGVGQAELNAAGSNRAAAQTIALADALADAKTQASAIAAAAGVTISGVVSVSAAVTSFGPVPLVETQPNEGPPQPVPTVAPDRLPWAYPQQLNVSVTVEYGIG